MKSMERSSGKIVIEKVVKFYTFMLVKKNQKNRKEKERRKVGSLLNQLMYSFVLSGRYLHYFVVYYIYGLMGVGRYGNAN